MKTITTIFTNIKAWLIAGLLFLLYFFGHHKGKSSQEIKTLKEEQNANKIANKARSGLNNSDRVKRLHDKYKR